jgi:hypothetical protein
MPNRRSRAARRPSLEQLLLPRSRRYRVRPSRSDRPRRPRTLSRIERKREGLSTYPRPRPLVERTDCSSIPRPSVHLLSIPTDADADAADEDEHGNLPHERVSRDTSPTPAAACDTSSRRSR